MTEMTVDISFALASGKRATFTNQISTSMPAGDALAQLEAHLETLRDKEAA